MAGGGVVAMYGLGSGMYHVTSTVLSLDLKQAFAIGLVTGLVGCGSLAVAASVASRRFVTINVNAVQRRAISELSKSAGVTGELGPNIRAGGLRAYNTSWPRLRRSPHGMGMALLEPRARMLLQVRYSVHISVCRHRCERTRCHDMRIARALVTGGGRQWSRRGDH